MNISNKQALTDQVPVTVGTVEVEIFQVPSDKSKRVVYELILNEQSGAANGIKFRIYDTDGTTLLKEWYLKIGASATINLTKNIETPVLTVDGGKYLKAIADAASIEVLVGHYDLE